MRDLDEVSSDLAGMPVRDNKMFSDIIAIARNVRATLKGGTPVKTSGTYVREYINHLTAKDFGLGCLFI